MNYKEKEKIVNDYFGITQRLIEKHGREKLRPDYFDFIVGRIMGWFPCDCAEISIMLKDKLNAELGFNI